MTIEVQVGRSYKNARGQIVHVHTDRMSVAGGCPYIYRYIGDQGMSYSSDGTARAQTKSYDLVEEITS